MKEQRDGLVGMFFHSFEENGELCWQGRVTRKIEPGWYLVETFDWVSGGAAWGERLVRLDDMVKWLFYQDAETMKESYQFGPVSRIRKPRELAEAGL